MGPDILSILPCEECVVDQFLIVHEDEAYQPVGLRHAECACAGVVFFGGTAVIIELVDGCQRLEVRVVHVCLLLLPTSAGKGECRVPEHWKIIPVRLLIPEEVDRDDLPVSFSFRNIVPDAL